MVAVLNMCSNTKKLIFVLVISFFLFSCTANDESSDSHAVPIVPLTFQQWSQQLEAYQSNIVVVDMWAMWCVSCLERFPEMVKLHEKYQDRNVRFVSMNIDDREDTQAIESAEKFLGKMNASFDHFRIDESMLAVFEEFKLLSIPAVIIYDEKGHEKYRLTGDNPNKQFTEKDIDSAIISLLQ